MSYIDETLSTFPTTLDQFNLLLELPPAQVTNAARYMVLLQKTRTSEEEQEFAILTTTLNDYLLNSSRWNKFASCVYALEKFFSENTTGYIATKQTEWEAILNQFSDKGTYNPVTTYQQWNTTQYNGETYCSKINNNLNHTPVGGVEDTWWQKLAQKGISGEKGIQGLPGVGLVFRYEYSDTTTYNTNEAVSYQGSLYACKQDGVTGYPPSNTTYWGIAIAKGASTIVSELRYTATLSNSTSNVEFIGVGKISAFNKNLDSLFIYVNSIYLELNQDYSLNINGISIDKLQTTTSPETTWSSGTIINFVVLKNVVEAITFNDGQLIDDESITINKLSTGLQTSVNSIVDIDGSFKIKSAFYTSGTDTLSVIIASGTGETINGNTINIINKMIDTTFTITPVSASVTYTIYLKNDGNFDKSTDSTIAIGSVTIGTISTNADKSVNIIVDERPLVSGVGKDLTAHKADYVRQPAYGQTAGSADIYTFTSTPALPALVDGVSAYLDIKAANTGASTLNWDGTGAKPIVNGKGVALTAGKLPLNGIVGVRYNLSIASFQLQGEGASGNAIASDLLSGKTAGSDAGDLVGSMPEQSGGAMSWITNGNSPAFSIPDGHYNAKNGWVTDANLIAANILSGKNIFGIAGTLIDGSTKKGYATGTITTDASGGGSVTGLTFTPRLILTGQIITSLLYIHFTGTGASGQRVGQSGSAPDFTCADGQFIWTYGLNNSCLFTWWAWE